MTELASQIDQASGRAQHAPQQRSWDSPWKLQSCLVLSLPAASSLVMEIQGKKVRRSRRDNGFAPLEGMASRNLGSRQGEKTEAGAGHAEEKAVCMHTHRSWPS